ncbi:hypothetical protein [Parasediminibacterium sp. JCM 36343]
MSNKIDLDSPIQTLQPHPNPHLLEREQDQRRKIEELNEDLK